MKDKRVVFIIPFAFIAAGKSYMANIIKEMV